MVRLKLFLGFLFFLVGCGLAMFLLAMSLDESTYPESLMLWFGVSSVFSILLGLFILIKGDA
jgi:hypothetical protein